MTTDEYRALCRTVCEALGYDPDDVARVTLHGDEAHVLFLRDLERASTSGVVIESVAWMTGVV